MDCIKTLQERIGDVVEKLKEWRIQPRTDSDCSKAMWHAENISELIEFVDTIRVITRCQTASSKLNKLKRDMLVLEKHFEEIPVDDLDNLNEKISHATMNCEKLVSQANAIFQPVAEMDSIQQDKAEFQRSTTLSTVRDQAILIHESFAQWEKKGVDKKEALLQSRRIRTVTTMLEEVMAFVDNEYDRRNIGNIVAGMLEMKKNLKEIMLSPVPNNSLSETAWFEWGRIVSLVDYRLREQRQQNGRDESALVPVEVNASAPFQDLVDASAPVRAVGESSHTTVPVEASGDFESAVLRELIAQVTPESEMMYKSAVSAQEEEKGDDLSSKENQHQGKEEIAPQKLDRFYEYFDDEMEYEFDDDDVDNDARLEEDEREEHYEDEFLPEQNAEKRGANEEDAESDDEDDDEEEEVEDEDDSLDPSTTFRRQIKDLVPGSDEFMEIFRREENSGLFTNPEVQMERVKDGLEFGRKMEGSEGKLNKIFLFQSTDETGFHCERLTFDTVKDFMSDYDYTRKRAMTERGQKTSQSTSIKTLIEEIEKSDSTRHLNMLSLEVSGMERLRVTEPEYVRQRSVVSQVERRMAELMRAEPSESLRMKSEDRFPPFLKFLLISMNDSYTNIHVDPSGTGVYYHVIHGSKVFYVAPPTEANMALYKKSEKEAGRGKNNWKLGCQLLQRKQFQRVEIKAGEMAFLPPGYLHFVYTPEHSIVIGGNFLLSDCFETHCRATRCEYVAVKAGVITTAHLFPAFELTCFSFIQFCLLKDLKSATEVNNHEELERLRPIAQSLLTQLSHKMHQAKECRMKPNRKNLLWYTKPQRRYILAELETFVDPHATSTQRKRPNQSLKRAADYEKRFVKKAKLTVSDHSEAGPSSSGSS